MIKVGAERIRFIQKILIGVNVISGFVAITTYHRHVVADMIPPPIRGPQINATPDTAPISPLGSASFERGTEFDRIVSTPDNIPPAPRPAIARPLTQSLVHTRVELQWLKCTDRMNVTEFGAVAQMMEPSSRIVSAVR